MSKATDTVSKGSCHGVKFAKGTGVPEIHYFFDYFCHYCGVQWKEFDSLLKSKNNFSVCLRHFPVIGGQKSILMAKKIEAAEKLKPGAGKSIHELFYKKGWRAQNVDDYLSVQFFDEKLQNSMNSKEVQGNIIKDISKAQELGIRGTPSLWVNGKVYQGLQSAKRIESIIK